MTGSDQVGADPSRADELVARPAESLNVEIKNWLDPSDDLHVAKLVKGLFAIRNRNGGFPVIGFNDKTLQPDAYALGRPLEEAYHLDEFKASYRGTRMRASRSRCGPDCATDSGSL